MRTTTRSVNSKNAVKVRSNAAVSAPLLRCKKDAQEANLHWAAKWGLRENATQQLKAKQRQGLTSYLAPVRRHCLTKSSLPWMKRAGSSGSCAPEGFNVNNRDAHLSTGTNSPLTIRLNIGIGSSVVPASRLR